MGRNVVPAAERSNPGAAINGGKSRNKGRQIHPAIGVFLRIHAGKKKPEALLEGLTGASRSFCEKVISGRSQPGGAMLDALIQSEIGDQVVDAIASAAPRRPTWHRRYRAAIERADLRANLKDMQRRLERLEQEDDQ